MSDAPSSGHNRLRGINPEKLLVVEAEEIQPLLELQYAELWLRGKALAARVTAWQERHKDGAVPIADEAEHAHLADMMQQLRDFAGDDGEADTARKKVKIGPWEACKVIDAAFAQIREPILAALGLGKRPAVGTMQYAQTEFLLAKAAKVQAAREAVAREAQAEAQRLADGARSADDEDLDAAVDLAMAGEERAAVIAADAQAPIREMARTRTAMGTTSTLTGTWDFDADHVDMKALCRAVADGVVPVTFVTVDGAAIRHAIRAKVSPLRECPGLSIKQTFAARRSK